MTPFITLYRSISPARWALIIVVAAALLGLAFQGGSLWSSHRRDMKFEEQEKRHEKERQAWMHDRESLVASGDASLKKHDEELAKRVMAEALLKSLGGRGEALMEKSHDEDQKFMHEMVDAGIAVEPCVRVKRNCARLKIRAEDCTCE